MTECTVKSFNKYIQIRMFYDSFEGFIHVIIKAKKYIIQNRDSETYF